MSFKHKQYNYILLDWDGTLAKTLDIWLEAERSVLNALGHYPDDHELGASFGNFYDYFPSLGLDSQGTFREVAALAEKRLPNVELYPGTLELLQYLRKHNKHTALLTSSLHKHIAHLLERHELTGLFDAVLAGDDLTHHKPHPEQLEKGLTALGGRKDQAVIIGDSDKDLGAAHNFGIDSILFHSPSHEKFYPRAELETLHPTFVVTRLEDIKKIIG